MTQNPCFSFPYSNSSWHRRGVLVRIDQVSIADPTNRTNYPTLDAWEMECGCVRTYIRHPPASRGLHFSLALVKSSQRFALEPCGRVIPLLLPWCVFLVSFALILNPKPFWHGKGVLMMNETSYNPAERSTSQTEWNSQQRNSPTPTFADNTTSKSMHITQRSSSKGSHKMIRWSIIELILLDPPGNIYTIALMDLLLGYFLN